MLVKLSLKNFKSFIEKTTIDFNATGYEILSETNKTNDGILKGALFIGGNATGKSTIINSLSFLLRLLLGDSEVNFLWYKSMYSDVKDRMELEYEFKINNSNIKYIIETSNDLICKELLIQDGKEVLVRINNSGEYINNDNVKITIDNLKNNQSAVRKVYFDTRFIDNKVLEEWYEFLKNSIYIDQYNKIISGSNLSDLHDYIENNGVEQLNKFFEEINSNQIVDYVEEYKNKWLKLISNNGKKNIIMIRNDMNVGLPLSMESEGNRTLLYIIPQLFKTILKNGMLIIDEFSSSLHNFLEEKIIRYFMENSKRSQIFIVSHSTNLLSNTIFRPDQIYSVDFIDGKGSKVERISDSKPREAQNLEKMYLSGVFNGIPNIKR